MNKEYGRLIRKLKTTYKNQEVKRDMFQKRKMTAREYEIQTGMREPKFPDDLDKFVPTQENIDDKGESP